MLATYPLDMIRARLAFQVAGEDVYLGIIHAIKVIVTKEGGVTALYRGIVPTMIGMVPYAGGSGSHRNMTLVQVTRPPRNKKLFPVDRLSGLKRADWNFFSPFFVVEKKKQVFFVLIFSAYPSH